MGVGGRPPRIASPRGGAPARPLSSRHPHAIEWVMVSPENGSKSRETRGAIECMRGTPSPSVRAASIASMLSGVQKRGLPSSSPPLSTMRR